MLSSSVQVQTGLSPAMYNGLPILEEANAYIWENGLVEQMTQAVGPIFVRHGLADVWGVYILHHHWNIQDGEAPGEDLLPGDYPRQRYVMRPVPVQDLDRYVPVTLIARANRFQALEFSASSLALDAYRRLAAAHGFLDELYAAFVTHGLSNHFGLAFIKPQQFEDRPWLETTVGGQRQSMSLEVLESDFPTTGVIKTSWLFAKGDGGNCFKKCMGNCISGEGHFGTRVFGNA